MSTRYLFLAEKIQLACRTRALASLASCSSDIRLGLLLSYSGYLLQCAGSDGHQWLIEYRPRGKGTCDGYSESATAHFRLRNSGFAFTNR